MKTTRRGFLKTTAVTCLGSAIATSQPVLSRAEELRKIPMIIDTHQHLWDLSKLKLPWLGDAPEVLRKSYHTSDYLEATRGLNVKAIYMEVDVDAEQHLDEAKLVVGFCKSDDHPTMAAVVGGRPASPHFGDYVKQIKKSEAIKGVRQVLHNPSIKPEACLQKPFVRGIQLLGQQGLSFDLCMRPRELKDGVKLIKQCPDTQFIVDHCGNADPKAFREKSTEKPWHEVDAWKRDMEALAKGRNVICKISGIVAQAPKDWKTDDLVPIVNHCLDVFGDDRVVFGGDWPVCLLGSPLRRWIDSLAEIISQRPAETQDKLWHKNAQRWYALTT